MIKLDGDLWRRKLTMGELLRKSRLIPLDPNAFGTSTLLPYTIDFPMPRGIKPPRDAVQPAEPTQSADEPNTLR